MDKTVDMLSPDKIKKEPGDVVSVLSSPTKLTATSSGGRIVTLVASSKSGGTTPGQKTILLVQAVSSKPSGIQSLLLPPGLRTVPSTKDVGTTGTSSQSVISALTSVGNTSSVAKLAECAVTPARSGLRVVAVTSQGSVTRPTVTAVTQPFVEVQTTYGLVFNSRTIQADGTVCSLKEYLCNFCQFKVSTPAALLEHFSTHMFSCNYCSFRSTSRLDALVHKRDTHPAAADELAGFEDISHPTLVAKTSRNRLVGAALVPPVISSAISKPLVTLPPRSLIAAGNSVTTSSTLLVSTKPTTSVSTSSPSNVIRTISGKSGDNYFTYRIAHDADGKVQAYECDVCGFRSTRIGEMFAHASTHTLADLAKSGVGNSDIVWECFYCAFTAPQQATVVSHVIATHPNKPIQLKRLMASAVDARSADVLPETPKTTLKPTTAEIITPQEDSTIPEQASSDKKQTLAASNSAKKIVADGKQEKKKKIDAEDGCIWGCYYCSMQSASRNDIICHLKKEHSAEKLVVTRRRITHVTSDLSENKTKEDNKTVPRATDKEVSEKDKTSEVVKVDGKSKRKQTPITSVHADPNAGDSDSADFHHGTGKSRRKQVAPRRVADEVIEKSPSDTSSMNNSLTDNSAVSPAVTPSKTRLNRLSAKSLLRQDLSDSQNTESVKSSAVSSGTRKHGRSVSKYDGLIKKLKMAESEDCKLETSLGLDKLAGDPKDAGMPELQKAVSGKSPGGGTKALSLLTGQMVSGYIRPVNNNVVVPALTTDTDMPILRCESQMANGDLGGKIGCKTKKYCTGLKTGIVRVVSCKRSDRSRNIVYDSVTCTARCGVCGSTSCGKDALVQMREHVSAHFNECQWACAYCTYQCDRLLALRRHIRRRHCQLPLRVIRRQFCNGQSSDSTSPLLHKLPQLESVEGNCTPKLNGPRSAREIRRLNSSDSLWQCPFCSRRSVFRGFIQKHIKVSHMNIDLSVPPQHWLRHHGTVEEQPELKKCIVTLYRIKDTDMTSMPVDISASNIEESVWDMDTDDEAANTCEADADALEFRCLHCHYRGCHPSVVKCHILQTHPAEDVTVLDMRSSRRLNHEHIFMCKNVECQFISSVQESFDGHLVAHPSHSANCLVMLESPDEQKTEKPQLSLKENRPRIRLTTPVASRLSIAKTDKNTPAPLNSVYQSVDGPVEYNEDGTVKGVQFEPGSLFLKCVHCDLLKSSNPAEMRSHLIDQHRHLVPQAVIDTKASGNSASYLFCPASSCQFVAMHGNVLKQHIDAEHPGLDVSFQNRPNRRRSLENTRRQSGMLAGVRASKKIFDTSYDSQGSDVNGTRPFSPSSSGDDSGKMSEVTPSQLLVIQDDDSSVNMQHSDGSTSKKSHYADTRGFDFSRRYKCILCSFAIATLADMKAHLTTVHDSNVTHQCIDRRARQLRKRQGILFCPEVNCSFCCKLDDELVTHMELEHNVTRDTVTSTSGLTEDACPSDRVYQCSHCTYITTDLRNVRIHVVAEHAATDGGFAEIKTAVGSDGSVIMNVSDRGIDSSDSVSRFDSPTNFSSVKVDGEGKIYTVL